MSIADCRKLSIRGSKGTPGVLIRFHGRKVVEIRFIHGGRVGKAKQVFSGEESAFAERLRTDFTDYFTEKAVDFTGYELEPETGTEFQRWVWEVLRRIPYGETRTYRWVAEAIGKPDSVRAVGNACGANPVPIIQPCHRIVASDGSLGGFSGGISLKRKLLSLEGIHF